MERGECCARREDRGASFESTGVGRGGRQHTWSRWNAGRLQITSPRARNANIIAMRSQLYQDAMSKTVVIARGRRAHSDAATASRQKKVDGRYNEVPSRASCNDEPIELHR